MKPATTIDINARFYMEQRCYGGRFLICDRMRRVKNGSDKIIFANGTEKECREYIKSNYTTPAAHAPGPFEATGNRIFDARGYEVGIAYTSHEQTEGSAEAHAALFAQSSALLKLLKQYHEAMPTKESGELILRAEGWKE